MVVGRGRSSGYGKKSWIGVEVVGRGYWYVVIYYCCNVLVFAIVCECVFVWLCEFMCVCMCVYVYECVCVYVCECVYVVERKREH